MVEVERIKDYSKFNELEILSDDGLMSTCFKLGDDKVVKVLEQPITDRIMQGNIHYLGSIITPSYINIDKLYYIKKSLVALEMKRVKGFYLERCLRYISLSDMYKHLDKVYESSNILGENHIKTRDVNSSNILYDGEIKIVDTDEYIVSSAESVRNCQLNNYKVFNFTLMELLLDGNFSIIYNNPELLKIYGHTLKVDPNCMKELLYMMKVEILKKQDTEVDTVGDLRKIRTIGAKHGR